jgi:hypothetical protein
MHNLQSTYSSRAVDQFREAMVKWSAHSSRSTASAALARARAAVVVASKQYIYIVARFGSQLELCDLGIDASTSSNGSARVNVECETCPLLVSTI